LGGSPSKEETKGPNQRHSTMASTAERIFGVQNSA